jgi:Tfp pilus assembly protein PilO
MKPTRQQLLLAVLALIAIVQMGDWVLNTMIQGPLQLRRDRTDQLQKDIRKRESLLAESRNAGKEIEVWQKQSLPADPEVARSGYRSWLLSVVKGAKLRNAVVDSGSPSSRRMKDNSVLYRSLPFSVRARGSLAQFNEFLFRFSKAGHLHQISSLTLNPVSGTGQFDISVGVETLLLPTRKGEGLNTASSTLLASAELRDYEVIVKDNIFGIGIDSSDPMKHTMVSAITFSNGSPEVWITEELSDKTTRVRPGADFNTVALSGRVVEVHEREVIIETSGDHMLFPIGQPFSEAKMIEVTP